MDVGRSNSHNVYYVSPGTNQGSEEEGVYANVGCEEVYNDTVIQNQVEPENPPTRSEKGELIFSKFEILN